MIPNAFGDLAADEGESFPVGRKDNSGSSDIQVGLLAGGSEPAVVHLVLY